MNHLEEFNKAWASNENIQIELDPININKILDEKYKVEPGFRMTKSQLWDMEVRKAARPDIFIPSVIKDGSAAAWNRTKKGDIETLIRVSEQCLWLNEEQFGVVIENVYIDHQNQTITFIGEVAINSEEGELLSSGTIQPIFHVQHGVVGNENEPLNTWRIVHLSSQDKEALQERFEIMNNYPWLPEYVEIYIKKIIGTNLERVY